MQLLELPVDVFRTLIEVTVRELGLVQSMKARLVSRAFADEILDAIVTTRVIEECDLAYRGLGVWFNDRLDLCARWVSQRVRDRADTRHHVMILRETIQMLVQHSGTNHQSDPAHIEMLERSTCSCLVSQWSSNIFWLLAWDENFLDSGKTYEGGIRANCLTVAAWIGDMSLIKAFDAVGPNPHNLFGWPLCAAAAQGHTEIVQYLLERTPGFGVDARDLYLGSVHRTPLCMAVYMGQESVVRLLLKPRYYTPDGLYDERDAIIIAAENEQLAILSFLLDHYRHIDGPVKPTFTSAITDALLSSCKRRAYRSAQILLQLGANINVVNGDPRTCLQLAAISGSASTVKLLLDWNASLEPADRYPPEDYHKWRGKRPLPRNRQRRSALIEARNRGFTAVAELIEEKLAEGAER